MMPWVWVALVLGIGVTTCAAQSTERQFERTFPVSGSVSLDLNTDAGGILVRSGTSGTVRVRGILKAQWSLLSGFDVEDRIRQLEANPPIEANGNSIRVAVGDKSILRGISMRLEVDTPTQTGLRARTDSGGIEVHGIQGPIDCQTDSGGVRATDIGGDVRARTDSGGIHIRKANGEVRAHADSGGVEAMEVAGRVEAETDSGGIRISQTQAASIHARADSGGADIALAPTSGYEITARSRNGRVTADNMTATRNAARGALDGRLRGGGPLVDVRVDSGSVTIH
jgi:Putative adhesin